MSNLEEGQARAWRRPLNLFIFSLCVSIIFLYATYTRTILHPEKLIWSKWAYSEWLINYSSGFIRRGLAGTLIQKFVIGASSVSAVNHFVFFNCVIFTIALFILIVTKKGMTAAGAALIVFAPGMIYNLISSGEFYFRKEVVFWSCLAIGGIFVRISYGCRSWPLSILRPIFVFLIYAMTAFCMLIHEGFLFLGAPVFAMFILRGFFPENPRAAFRLSLVYIVWCLALFMVCSVYKGGQQSALLIWNNLSAYDRATISEMGDDISSPLGGISAIAWGPRTALFLFFRTMLSGSIWYWVSSILFTCLFISVIPTERKSDENSNATDNREWVGVYIFLLIAISPMFVFGMDWGRWIVDLNITYMILFMTLNSPPIPSSISLRLVPSWLWVCAPRALTPVLMVILIVMGLSFEVPECCLKGTAPLLFDNVPTILVPNR